MTYSTPAVVASGEIATKTQTQIVPQPRALDGGSLPSAFKTVM